MKTGILCWWSIGAAIALLPLAGGRLQDAVLAVLAVQQPQVFTAPASSDGNTSSNAPPDRAVSSAEEHSTNSDISEAPIMSGSTHITLPRDVRTNGPMGEIIKLANAGVGEGVMEAYITNSTSVFALNADEIVYLRDIGVPSAVITLILQHDEQVKATVANNAASESSSAPEQYAPAPETEAPPPETAQAPAPPDNSRATLESPATAQPPSPPPETADYSVFYDSLAPYGTWVDLQDYGPCWQPTIAVINPDWAPYFDGGHWNYTDCGWYWLSDYTWGWAPFHYGRWFWHHRLGWCWRPDRFWGPSWVAWRYNDDYCGWAPLPPAAVFRPGFGLTFGGHGVGVNFTFGLGAARFSFVAWDHFYGHDLRSDAVPFDRARSIFPGTVVSSRITGDRHHAFNQGLPLVKVAWATRSEVHKVALRDFSGPPRAGFRELFNGRTLSVSHPNFTRREGSRPGVIGPRRFGSERINRHLGYPFPGRVNSDSSHWNWPALNRSSGSERLRTSAGPGLEPRENPSNRQEWGINFARFRAIQKRRDFRGTPNPLQPPSQPSEPTHPASPTVPQTPRGYVQPYRSLQTRLPGIRPRGEWYRAGRPDGGQQANRFDRRSWPPPSIQARPAQAQVPRYFSRGEVGGYRSFETGRQWNSRGFQPHGQTRMFNSRSPAFRARQAPSAAPAPRMEPHQGFFRRPAGGRPGR